MFWFFTILRRNNIFSFRVFIRSFNFLLVDMCHISIFIFLRFYEFITRNVLFWFFTILRRNNIFSFRVFIRSFNSLINVMNMTIFIFYRFQVNPAWNSYFGVRTVFLRFNFCPRFIFKMGDWLKCKCIRHHIYSQMTFFRLWTLRDFLF